MDPERMRGFWDARAREDAVFFVDSRQAYGQEDLDLFFEQGKRDLDLFFDRLGVALRQEDTVVEIGCGLGRLTRAMSEMAHRVVALDISEEMLERARELNSDLGNVDWVLGDGVSLEGLSDDLATACVSTVVFQHIPEPAVTLGYVREVGRVLTPGGWAALNISNDPRLHRPTASLGRRIRALVGRGPRGQAHPAWLGSSVELVDLRQAADEADLDVRHIVGEGTQYCCAHLVKRAPSEQGRPVAHGPAQHCAEPDGVRGDPDGEGL